MKACTLLQIPDIPLKMCNVSSQNVTTTLKIFFPYHVDLKKILKMDLVFQKFHLTENMFPLPPKSSELEY